MSKTKQPVDIASVHAAMLDAPHDGSPFRQVRAVIKAIEEAEGITIASLVDHPRASEAKAVLEKAMEASRERRDGGKVNGK